MFISSEGEYLYCYNDMAHSQSLGNVNQMSLRQAIEMREQTAASDALCNQCNMRGRYQGTELVQVAANYFKNKLIAMAI